MCENVFKKIRSSTGELFAVICELSDYTAIILQTQNFENKTVIRRE